MAESPFDPARGSPAERELQASSETFLIELAQLEGLERLKRSMAIGDEHRAPLAHEIEDRTLALVGLSRYQTRLIEMEGQLAGGAAAPPRTPAIVMTEWRDAEQALRDARSAMTRATDAADRLRDEHGRAVRHYSAE